MEETQSVTNFEVWNQDKGFEIVQGQFLVKREVCTGAFPGKPYTKCKLQRVLGSFHAMNLALT